MGVWRSRSDETAPPRPAPQQTIYVPAPPPVMNKWERGRPITTEEAASSTARVASPSQFPRLGGTTPSQLTTQEETATHDNNHGNTEDNIQLMQCIRTLTKELENLKQEVRQLRNNSNDGATVISDSARKDEEENTVTSGEGDGAKSVRPKQRKLKIKGVEKTLKVHDFMVHGFGKVEGVLNTCGNDEKKDKVFKGWIELYKHMTQFTKELDGVSLYQADNAP
ncbi:hypothetical protein E2C01_065602 [Portunus trituberculatus]|uniref:Uncharacterized protein n=1 Tax=Portunus trituberculatus TaxID=210409 RepID=A0A5B7HMZ9_PORTR|nr:hypothetical protein [Portunus trituberculatus]